MSGHDDPRRRLVAVTLDETSIGRGTPDQEHERAIAIYDLVQDNFFALPDRDDGPYALKVSLHDARLALDVSAASGEALVTQGDRKSVV